MFHYFEMAVLLGTIIIIISGLFWRFSRQDLSTLICLDFGIATFLMGQTLMFIFFRTGIGPYGKHTHGIGAWVWIILIFFLMGILTFHLNRSFFKPK